MARRKLVSTLRSCSDASLGHVPALCHSSVCSVEETYSGCTGGGPYWEWLPPLPVPVPLDDQRLALYVSDDPPVPSLLEAPLALALDAHGEPVQSEPTGGGPQAAGTVPSVVGE